MTTITQHDFLYVKKLVEERAAIMLESGKEYLVASRLNTLAREEGYGSHVELIAEIRARPNARMTQRVIEAMTTNETSFFRDARPFDALRTTIIPEMIAKRQSTKTLNIWCAACSSGQEPYTIWMVIRDHFPELANWRVKILGTDLSTEILTKARDGRYSQLEVNRGIPTTSLVRHFERDGVAWKIHNDARRVVEFRELNLIEHWPPLPKPDIVFLRNVLIYFDLPTKKKILSRVAGLMAPDGYLFLGAGETTLNIESAFNRVDIDRAGCFRLGTNDGPSTTARTVPHGAQQRKEDSWTPRATTSTR